MDSDHSLDLDLAATEIAARVPQWTRRGLRVDEITWTDASDRSPTVLYSERSKVGQPRSIGVCVLGPGDAQVRAVLFSGGWADVAYLPPGLTEPEIDAPEISTAEHFGETLDSAVGRLLADLGETD